MVMIRHLSIVLHDIVDKPPMLKNTSDRYGTFCFVITFIWVALVPLVIVRMI